MWKFLKISKKGFTIFEEIEAFFGVADSEEMEIPQKKNITQMDLEAHILTAIIYLCVLSIFAEISILPGSFGGWAGEREGVGGAKCRVSVTTDFSTLN